MKKCITTFAAVLVTLCLTAAPSSAATVSAAPSTGHQITVAAGSVEETPDFWLCMFFPCKHKK